MRVVFAGTPVFAERALTAILQAGYTVPLVLTQPDRPAGRGLKLTPSPVKQAALDAGIPVAQPRSLKLDGKYSEDAQAARDALHAAAPDVMVVAAYGLILPQWVLALPRYGCLNIHASLLPRWRGAAPIQRAIEAGDAATGITIMQMDEGLDTGAMLLRVSVPIHPGHTASTLHDTLASAGASAIIDALEGIAAGALVAQPQPEAGVTYAQKLDKRESPLDFTQAAQVLARRVDAFNPVPGATVTLPGLDDVVKVWRAVALPEATQNAAMALAAGSEVRPGDLLGVTEHGIDIMTGDGVLRLLEVQRPGGRRQPVDVFVRSWKR